MSNIPISSLPVAIALDGSEEVPLVQGGTTKRTTTAAIVSLGGTGLPSNAPLLLTEPFALTPSGRTFTPGSYLNAVDSGAGSLYTLNVLYPAPTNVTSGGTTTIGSADLGDFLVNVNSSVTMQLPTAASRGRFPVSVVDIGGYASLINPITIVPNGAETIMGFSSLPITSAYGGYTLWPIATGGWYLKG